MDGIDLAVVQTDGRGYLKRDFVPAGLDYDDELRNRLERALRDAKQITSPEQRPGSLSEAELELTEIHAGLVNMYLEDFEDKLPPIDLIGFHGQTVLHRPDEGLTVQIGDGELLADLTGIPVVCDMRSNDMDHGGQGAPLAPAYHCALAENLPKEFKDQSPVMFINIGGISNVTFVGDEPIAFDSGPGNTLMDQWMQRHFDRPFDEDGQTAKLGNVIEEIVDRFMSKPFFQLAPPKSLDRFDFQLEDFEECKPEDVLRSLVRVTSQSIIAASNHLPEVPKLWVLTGGGCQNLCLLEDITSGAAAIGGQVVTADEVGFSSQTMEAEAWAYLAVRSVDGLPLTFPGTTGCKEPVTGGKLVKD